MENKKNCLNPKCNKEFTPKNAKGVYCSSNCRAAHAYHLKKNGMSKESIKHFVDYMETYKGTPNLNKYMASRPVDNSGFKLVSLKELETALKLDGFRNALEPKVSVQNLTLNPSDANRSIDTGALEGCLFDSYKLNERLDELKVEEIKKRIAELEKELKSPPKNPLIGLRKWTLVRQQEIDKLKQQL